MRSPQLGLIVFSTVTVLACGQRTLVGDADEPLPSRVIALESNSEHHCAISEAGELRCWGRGTFGLLANGERPECGVGTIDLPTSCVIGDDEPPSTGPPLDLGGPVVGVAIGDTHACAILEGGSVRCWGQNYSGALLGVPGTGETAVIGDDESPSSLTVVEVGAPVVEVVAGSVHTCVRTDVGGVRCWGVDNGYGILGYGMTVEIGDDETPASFGDVPIGGPVVAIAARQWRSCAVLEAGTLRCWGAAGAAMLGYGEAAIVDTTPEEAGDIPLAADVVDVALSEQASCVLDRDGSVWCWGEERYLGAGRDGFEVLTSDQAIEVPIGAEVESLAGGPSAMCVVTIEGGVRCWGEVHGYPGGAKLLPGYDKEVAELGDLELGATATSVTVGAWNVACAVTTTGAARCWGRAPYHGYPGLEDLGDDEPPGAAGDLDLF